MTQPELPPFLYKYITWEKPYHKKIIQDNEIFFTSADNFNDPFDSSVPLRYDLGSDDQIFQLYKKHMELMDPHLTQAEINRVARNEMEINNPKDPNRVEEQKAKQKKLIVEKCGVFSVTSNSSDILMWSHYSDSHKGICMRFNTNSFLQFIENEGAKTGKIIIGGKVEYQEEYPLLNPFDLDDSDVVLKPLLIKSAHWKYENEYRFILFDYSNIAIKIPDGVIDQIILGSKISESDQQELVELSRYKNIELVKAELNKDSFSLNYSRVKM